MNVVKGAMSTSDLAKTMMHPNCWSKTFIALVRYKKDHGDFIVPENSKNDKERFLGTWLALQRIECENMARNKPTLMTMDQWQMLQNIGFCCPNVTTPEGSKKQDNRDIAKFDDNSTLGSSEAPVDQLPWEIHFKNLISFKQKYGHCRVPLEYNDFPFLGVWVDRQRQQCHPNKIRKSESSKKNVLSAKFCLLNNIDFEWDDSVNLGKVGTVKASSKHSLLPQKRSLLPKDNLSSLPGSRVNDVLSVPRSGSIRTKGTNNTPSFPVCKVGNMLTSLPPFCNVNPSMCDASIRQVSGADLVSRQVSQDGKSLPLFCNVNPFMCDASIRQVSGANLVSRQVSQDGNTFPTSRIMTPSNFSAQQGQKQDGVTKHGFYVGIDGQLNPCTNMSFANQSKDMTNKWPVWPDNMMDIRMSYVNRRCDTGHYNIFGSKFAGMEHLVYNFGENAVQKDVQNKRLKTCTETPLPSFEKYKSSDTDACRLVTDESPNTKKSLNGSSSKEPSLSQTTSKSQFCEGNKKQFLDTFWWDRYADLQKFVQKNGHFMIPSRYTPNPALGVWLSLQKKEYKLWRKGRKETCMTKERATAMEQLGISWVVRKRDKSIGKKVKSANKNREDSTSNKSISYKSDHEKKLNSLYDEEFFPRDMKVMKVVKKSLFESDEKPSPVFIGGGVRDNLMLIPSTYRPRTQKKIILAAPMKKSSSKPMNMNNKKGMDFGTARLF